MAGFPGAEVVGLILAAGQSTRMGQPKALLPSPHTGRTFVTQIDPLAAEGGVDRDRCRGRVRPMPGCGARLPAPVRPSDFVDNPSHELGQLSSLLAGLAYAEAHGAAGALVVPVDMPLIRADTVRAALEALHAWGSAGAAGHVSRAARPSGDLRRRHVRRRFATPIPRWALERSSVKTRLGSAICEVDDPGVVRDIDLPDEYRRLFE